VPENLKPTVEEQIQELLRLGIIKPSKSEMGSPIVCVLKSKDGKDGIKIAIDYRYLNKYCMGDAHPLPDIPDLMQRVWKSQYKMSNKIHWIIQVDASSETVDATSKSPKLMRWALALQQYDVTFRYKDGRKNIVANCLSRLDLEN